MTLIGGVFNTQKDISEDLINLSFSIILIANLLFILNWAILFIIASKNRFENSFKWLAKFPCFVGVFEDSYKKKEKFLKLNKKQINSQKLRQIPKTPDYST